MASEAKPAELAYGLSGEPPRGGALRSRSVGERLRAAREAAGVSKQALGEAAGVSGQAVANIERGHAMPTVATAESLAGALGLSPAWLAFGEGPEVRPGRSR